MQWLLVACRGANCAASGSSSRADAGCAVIGQRVAQGADDGNRPMVTAVQGGGGTGALRPGTMTDPYAWKLVGPGDCRSGT